MYSSDRMKTLIIFLKDYDKKHRDYGLTNTFFKYLFEKKGLREAARNDTSAWEINSRGI